MNPNTISAEPIIPWPGGKARLAERLFPLFPPHECYVEAFAGGAALFFLRPTQAKCEVLNDINGELVNLYRIVQNHLKEFCRTLEWTLSSRSEFNRFLAMNPAHLTDIQRAARFFYIRQHAFGGRVTSPTFGTATTGGSGFNLIRIEEQLSAAHIRLSGVYIENLSWLDVCKRYDRAHTFLYLDPPYWQLEGYGVEFSYQHYLDMAEFMRTCAGKVMVSINDHPEIREAFAGLHFLDLEIAYSVGKVIGEARPKSRELVITNYDTGANGSLF